MAIFSILFVIGVFQTLVSTLPAPDDSRVDIHFHRVRRDVTDPSKPPEIQLKLLTSNSNHQVNLSNPENSIFTPGFKFLIAEEGKLKDVTPSDQNIAEIEQGHYVNPSLGAAFSVSNFDDDFEGDKKPKVRGFLDNLIVTPKDDNTHSASNRKTDGPPPTFDFIDLKRNVTPGIETRSIVHYQPEVYVVFDHANFNKFNGNMKDIIDYIAVFFHGINNRFATISDPKITFRISGITAISSPAEQPFMENNKTPDGNGNDINKVLRSFSEWVFANRNTIPKHDLATVITGRDLQIQDSTGKYFKNVAGIAYLKGACWVEARIQRSLATSIGEDIGGFYDGIYTMVHEFAHNLAAPHDGSGEAASCPWADGYQMSYLGDGKANKFRFSSCSIDIMKKFLISSGGSCMRSIENTNDIPVSKDNPGDRVSMTELCRIITKQPTAVVDSSKSPSFLCKNLVCTYPAPGYPPGWTVVSTRNRAPADNSACGTGNGRCVNGECV